MCTRGHSKARQCNKRHEHESWGLTPDVHGLESPQRIGGETSPTPLCCQHSRQQPHPCAANSLQQPQQSPSTRAGSRSSPHTTRWHAQRCPGNMHAYLCGARIMPPTIPPQESVHMTTQQAHTTTPHAPPQVERVAQRLTSRDSLSCAWTHAHDTGTARQSAHHMHTRKHPWLLSQPRMHHPPTLHCRCMQQQAPTTTGAYAHMSCTRFIDYAQHTQQHIAAAATPRHTTHAPYRR